MWFLNLNFSLTSQAYHMKSTGWVKISEEDVTELHYKYKQASGQL